MKNFYGFLLLLLIVSCQKVSGLENGDIIFQVSKSAQSLALQKATGSKYTHVGLIFIQNQQVFVYEAVGPVKLTPLNEWATRGVNGHYVVKRLKDRNQLLSKGAWQKAQRLAKQYKGKAYDPYFEWHDKAMYCSELVWKIYKRAANIEIGQLKLFKTFNLSDPMVKQALRSRYGTHIPLQERVIAPGDMFKSEKLYTVFTKGNLP